MIALAAIVVIANLPYLTGLVDPNPLGPDSGLAPITHAVLDGQPTLDNNAGYISQALGHRAALDLLHLHLPWWNPYEGTGAPLAGEMQAAAFFPPTLLTAISNGQLYEHMLLELIAGWSMFLLLRRLELRRVASAAGAVAFMFSGSFAWFTHATVNPVPFLPMLLLGIERAHAEARAGRRGGWWLIAVSGALSLYAGFPEVAYIDALLAVIWTIWRGSTLSRGLLRAFAIKTATGAVVGTLLSAPLLIAFGGYVQHGYLAAHDSGALGALHLSHLSLAQLLLPYVYGPIKGASLGTASLLVWGAAGGYLCTSLLVLGVLGVGSAGRGGLRIGMLAWIVLAVARMYGEPPGLGAVIGVVPDMSHIEFVRYAFPSLELAVIVLAALGVDELASGRADRRRVLVSTGISLVFVALAVYETDHTRLRWYFAAAVAWGLLIVVIAAAIAIVGAPRIRTMLFAGLMMFDTLVLFAIPDLSAPRTARPDLAPVAFLRRHLGEARFFTMGPLRPNYGTYFGLASLDSEDVPVPALFESFVRHRLDPGADATDFTGAFDPFRPQPFLQPEQQLLLDLAGYRAAGVTYVLAVPGTQLPQNPASLQRVFESSSTWIYHLSGSMPYFTATSRGCHVSSADRSSASLSCTEPTTLIRRETDLPGWSASVGGRPATIRRADGVFQAITVPPGSHRVIFRYAPPGFGWGFAAFAGGGLWLLVAFGIGRWRRGPPQPNDAPALKP